MASIDDDDNGKYRSLFLSLLYFAVDYGNNEAIISGGDQKKQKLQATMNQADQL